MVKMMIITWPLFWCLSPEDQAKLMQYQWDEYGYKLQIPPPPSEKTEPIYPTLDEIDKEMRKPPKRQKRVS